MESAGNHLSRLPAPGSLSNWQRTMRKPGAVMKLPRYRQAKSISFEHSA